MKLLNKDEILNRLNSTDSINISLKYAVNDVILFGSILTENFNEESDVDIAVIGHKKLSLDSLLEMELYYEKLLQRNIDIVDLRSDNLDLFVKINILNDGRIIYSNDNKKQFYEIYNYVDNFYKDNENYMYFRRRDLLS